MIRFKTLLLAVLLAFSSSALALKTKRQQLVAMEAILAEFETHYGMIKFKKKMFGVDYDYLRNKYTRLIDEARTLEEDLGWEPKVTRDILPPTEFQQLMIGMASEFKDAHVSIHRQGNELASIGLTAAPVGDQLIVTYVRKELMLGDSSMEEIKAGDEILELNDEPVTKIAERNLLYVGGGTFENRWIHAMFSVVLRPQGTTRIPKEGERVKVKFRRAGKDYLATLRWVYNSDLGMLVQRFPTEMKSPFNGIQMEDKPVPYGISGAVRSHFRQGLLGHPELGMIDIGQQLNMEIAKAQEIVNSADTEPAIKQAYSQKAALTQIHRLPVYLVRYKDKNVAVLRIPSYSPPMMVQGFVAEYRWLREALARAEKLADVLVIDQNHNSGGMVYYVAKMLGLFAKDGPMKTVLVDQKLNETIIERFKPSVSPDLFDGSRGTHAEFKFYEKYHKELKARYESGEEWTGLMAAFDGQIPFDEELPGEVHGAGVFSKPILLLSDRFSASGGDFFPAQMQANGRAVIMGETTCGLGGPLYRNIDSMPGSELFMRCTSSYAELPDSWPIENVGAVPDIPRDIRVSDLHEGFKTYATEVLNNAVGLVGVAVPDAKRPVPDAQLSVKIPNRLLKDRILKTLWKRREVLDRLKDMSHLPEFQSKADQKAIAKLLELESTPQDVEVVFANPCEIRLGMK